MVTETDDTGPDELISTAEAARLTGNKRGTLVQWRNRGTGPPFYRLGPKNIRYRRGDIERFIAESYVDPAEMREVVS